MKTSPALDVRFPADEIVLARVTARLDDLEPAAIHEIGPDAEPVWRVFFATPSARDAATEALTLDFAGAGLTVHPIDVEDEDWAARSQASLTAVRVGRILVAPPWDVPATAVDDCLVVIQPSMGFGTGHHETTRLCLALLQEAHVSGRDVLDVGTGSGVLAIAAALLGARAVRAFDVDEDAVESARENVALNEAALAARGVRPLVERGNLKDGAMPADLVVANLTGGLLVASAPALVSLVRAGGQLIVSGFQPHEADAVLRALAPAAVHVQRRREGDWEAALIAR